MGSGYARLDWNLESDCPLTSTQHQSREERSSFEPFSFAFVSEGNEV